MLNIRLTLLTVGVPLVLFLAMILVIELGRWLGARQAESRGPGAHAEASVANGPVYALLALLIGFTFNGAATRFDHRRELVIQEVVAINNAWHRIAFLPSAPQPAIRETFRQYLDALLATYSEPPGSPAETLGRAAVTRAQKKLWERAVAATLAEDGEKARMLLMPSLNVMFDVVDTERLWQRIHPPMLIYLMLGVAALAAGLFTGYGMASGTTRYWLHVIGVAGTIASAAFVIIELESPRLGLVRVDSIDQALTELRATLQ